MNTKKSKRSKKREGFVIEDFYAWEKEQEELEKYIRERPLYRPKTTFIAVIAWALLYLLVSFLAAAGMIFAFQITNGKWLIYVASYLLFALLFLKKICITSIECYQHYAKEETRRRCVCIPSCSEYSIAVLKKYHTFKALNKIRIRLFKTCGGNGYVRDDP